MGNPLYPIQVANYIKPIFKKENTLMIAISKRLESLAKDFEIKNVWYRFNPVNEFKFFVDYKKNIFFKIN